MPSTERFQPAAHGCPPEALERFEAARLASTTDEVATHAEAIVEALLAMAERPSEAMQPPPTIGADAERAPGTNQARPAPVPRTGADAPQREPAEKPRQDRASNRPGDDDDETTGPSEDEDATEGGPADEDDETKGDASEDEDATKGGLSEEDDETKGGASKGQGRTTAGSRPPVQGAGSGESEDQAEAAPDETESDGRAERAAERLLQEILREDGETEARANEALADLSEALRGKAHPIRDEAIPDDLHAEIELVMRHGQPLQYLLEPLERATRPRASQLARQLASVLDRKRQIERGLRRGRPDPLRLARAHLTDRVMMQRPESRETDVAMAISVDESGSMDAGNRVEPTREALMLLHLALHELRVPHAVLGHSARGPRVVARVLLGFQESLLPNAWWTLANGPYNGVGHDECGGNARDGYSLRVASRWLARRPEKRKILLFLSDGHVEHDFIPNNPARPHVEYRYTGRIGALDTRLAVREAARQGVTVIGISIGSEHAYMEQIYDRRICCRSVRELERVFARLVGSIVG